MEFEKKNNKNKLIDMKNKMRSKVHIAMPTFSTVCWFVFHFLFIYFYFYDWNGQFFTHTHILYTHLFHINSNPSINIYFNILLNGQLTWNDLLFQAHYTSLRLYDFNSISLVSSLFLCYRCILFRFVSFQSIQLEFIYATSFMRLHGISNICYIQRSWTKKTAKKDILR